MAEEEPKQVRKVVITMGDNQAMIGIQAPECDPCFTPVELVAGEGAAAPLDQALASIPELVDQAQARWREQARNPTYDRPAPKVQPAATSTTRTGRQTPGRPNEPHQQSLL